MRVGILFAVMFLLPVPAFAQVERYDLGKRMMAFESAWERADANARRRGVKAITPATRQFLTFQLTAASRTLDEATQMVLSQESLTDADLWNSSLSVQPQTRLMDAKAKLLTFTVKANYPTIDPPADAKLSVTSVAGRYESEIKKLPMKVTVNLLPPFPLNSGDERLTVHVDAQGRGGLWEVGISRVENLNTRLANLKNTVAKFPVNVSIEQATIAERSQMLTSLAAGDVFERDIPAARWLEESEAMLAPGAEPFFTPKRTGQHWLTVPTAGNVRTPCRLFVPGELKRDSRVPIVIGMHGMGGSENLFFDGYGAGCVAKACEKRGWFLLSARSGLGFLGGMPPVLDIVDELAKRYPIDREKIFLVGHSMGAAQVVDLVQKQPGKFAAAAMLGGGGRVRTAEPFRTLPTFIGIGSKDFALSGAKTLRESLLKGDAKAVTYREYEDIEHMVIVRAAVEDLFAMYDAVTANSVRVGPPQPRR